MRKCIQVKFVVFFLSAFFSIWSFANDCRQGETLIAMCQMKGKVQKVAYICADDNGKKGRYTFTRNDNVEMNISFDKNRKLQRWLDKGTYTTYFGFINEGYVYVLGVPEENYGAKAFLNVKKNNKYLTTKECDSNSFGNKEKSGEFIEDLSDDDAFNKSIFP